MLLIVLITKFLAGAWIAIAAMAVIYLLMLAIRRHYDRVAEELVPPDERGVLPARNHAVVLVSQLHLPTLRAVQYARATRPDTLTAVTVNVDANDTRRLQAEWEDPGAAGTADRDRFAVPGDHPSDHRLREETMRRDSPRDVVTVFIPEYVVGRWWEHLLHNQSALRIKARLLYEPGVMVTSVPWQLTSSENKNFTRYDRQLRRGVLRGPQQADGDESGTADDLVLRK